MRRQIIIGPDTEIIRVGGRPPRTVVLLLSIQIGLFLFYAFADAPAWVRKHLVVSFSQTLGSLELWQPFTGLWIHLATRPLLVNALMLWVLGSTLERWWGGRRFLLFWTTTGVAGLFFGMLVGVFAPNDIIYGSGGTTMAMMVAFSVLFTNRLLFFYGLLPLKAKYLALILIGFVVLGNLFAGAYMELAVFLGGGPAAFFFLFRRGRLVGRRSTKTGKGRQHWN
ncbi:MAG: rhomboid family intramembrane serine protease [Pseudomonadota bacterium]